MDDVYDFVDHSKLFCFEAVVIVAEFRCFWGVGTFMGAFCFWEVRAGGCWRGRHPNVD